jgi:hypothetical protein
MSDVTRRDAIKALAVAGTAVAAAGMAGPAKAAEEKATAATGWGKEGDQAFKLTEGKTPLKADGKAALLSDNCDSVKEDIKNRFQVYDFGSCNHPTPVDADVEAVSVCLANVIANGGVVNTEAGHKTIKHRRGPITYHTYLAYAAGDRP